MSDIHSIEEAYETITDALNYIEEHTEKLFVVEIMGETFRVVRDPDAERWFVQKTKFRLPNGD